MTGIPLTQDEQDQFNKEFGTNSYVSPSTASKSMPLTGAEVNQVLDEFQIKPDANNYMPPEIRSMGEDVASDLRNSFLIASKTTPEQAVKDVKMSNELSVPAEYFMDDSDIRDQVAEAFNNKKNSSIDWDGIVKQYPTLSQFLSDPKNMATAKDLIPELAEQDKHFQNIKQIYPGSTIGPAPKYQDTTIGSRQPSWWETVKQMAYSGAAQFNQGMYGLGRLPIEAVFGSDNSVVKWLNQRSADSQTVIDTAEEQSQAMRGAKKLVYTGGSATVNMVPTMALGMMTGGAGEATTLGREASILLRELKNMLPFGTQSVGQYAEEAKKEGASLSQQATYGLYGGSVEMVTELPFVRDYIAMTGSKEIVKSGIKNIVKEFGKSGIDFVKNTAEEAIQEVITSPLTQAVKKTLYQPDMPFFGDNGVISIPQAESDAYGAFAMTTIMHAMGLPFSSRAHQMAKAIIETGKAPKRSEIITLNKLAQAETPHVEESVKINEAKNNAEIYKKTGEIAAKSQYLDRLPESWHNLVEASTQGGKLENVYIDSESFVTLMQSMAPEGTDPGAIVKEVAKELGIENQLQEATKTGKPLSIPYATWLEKTAKTPIYKKLEGDIKFSEDGLTLNQAAAEEERIKKAIEEEQKQAKIQNTNYESIYNDIKDKLVSAGRNEREAKYSAQVFASRMIAEGARRQVNPLELYMGMMQPEVYNVDFMPNQISPDILGKLNDNERAFIETLAAQNKPIEQIQKGLQDQYDKSLNEHIKYLNESGGKGVQQGSLVTDALGNVINRIGRQSNNPKWYRDFYAEKGRKPSQKELGELAIKQLKEGYSEDTDNIPANNEFVQLENTIKGIKDLKDKIGKMMEANRSFKTLNQSQLSQIIVQGNELGNGLTNQELRDKAIDYYKNQLKNQVALHPVLGEVKFSNRGLRKVIATSADIRKLKLLPKLKELIETGTIISEKENEDKDTKPNIRRYIYLKNTAVLENAPVTVGITLYEDNNGNFYYNHNIWDEDGKKEKTSPVSAGVVQEDRTAPPYNEAFSTLSITPIVKNFKPDILFQGSLDSSNSSSKGFFYQFAGVNSKTADPLQLSNAQAMLNEGKDKEIIRKETGWFKGMDGKWRFEIDDFNQQIPFKEFGSKKLWTEKLGYIMKHDLLFKAYPDLKDILVSTFSDTKKDSPKGFYNENENTIYIHKDLSEIEKLRVLNHEIQHAIQLNENFARGGTPSQFKELSIYEIEKDKLTKQIDQFWNNAPEDFKNLARKVNRKDPDYLQAAEEMDTKFPELANEYFKLSNERFYLTRDKEYMGTISPEEQYRNLAGEIEARDAEKRSTLMPDERLETPPAFKEDAIVVFDGHEYKYSQDPRANVQINQDQSIITLFSNADASSFLHESSHLFLEDTFRYVRSGQADENYLKDWKTLSDWLGIKEDQDKLTTEQQEQFARGFESYLLEGKAPSEGLMKAFAAFRRWLTRIYKSINGLNVQLSDEVRGVMDRMLATEDEIQEREAIDGYLMAVVDQKDVTRQTWDQLEELKIRAHEMAIQKILQPQMDELKQDYQDFLNQERERVQKVIEEEVAQLPIYRVMEVVKQNFGIQKDVKELAERYLKNEGITDEGIARFEAIAESFGYTTGDHLAREIFAARSFADEVNDQVEVHMAQFNELKNSVDLKFEAEKAVHNDDQLEALALERSIFLELLNASDRKEREKQYKRQWNAERAKIEARAARKYAEKTLANKPYREASAATSYFAAERNAAIKQSQALAKKDYEEILRYGTQRLLNHALAVEAIKVKQEVDKHFRFLHKFQLRQRPKIDEAFLNQIDKILFRFKLIDNLSPKAKEDNTSLHEWIESRNASRDADIPDKIANEAFSKDYHNLTLGELRDVVHAIKNISKVAWNEKRLLTDGKRAEIKEVAQKLAVSISLNNEVLYPEDLDPNVDESKNIKLNVLKYLADHKKVEFIVRALDGYKDQGIAWRYIVLPIMRSMDKEYKLRREAGEKYGEIFRKHYGDDVNQLATKKIHSAELAHIFTKGLTKENILTMALNWGSELNQKRLIDGYLKTEEIDKEEAGMIIERYNNSPEAKTEPLSPGEIIKREKQKRIRALFSSFLERKMERNDWEFVQDVLDLVNSYWPMIVTVEKIRKGFAPEKREAKPIETPYGVYPGGYFHIAYDPRLTEQAYRHSEQDNLKGLLESTYVIPSTKSGFTKATVEEVVDRPLALNLSVVDKHLSDVIHMVSFINSIRDVDRILNERSVISAISQTRGKQEYRQFREWLEAIGYEYRNPLDATEKLLQKARMGAAVVNMGLKITTAVGQLAGVFPVMQRIGSWRTVAGMLDFHSKFVTGRAGDDINFVFENSEMMKNRAQTFDRDIKDVTKKLIKENKYDHIQDFWFKLTGLADLGVTIPTWIQSYNLHIENQIKAGKTMEQIDKEMAVRFADQVIRETQGSGDIANMAHIQRGSEFRKILTMFYSYFSVFANQMMESGDRAINRKEYGQLFSFAAYWWFLPAVASELLSGRGPGDDDDDTAKWLASTILRYPLSGFVVLRDVVNALGGKFGGYELSPVGDAFQKGIELWNATVQKGVEGKDIDWGKVGWNTFEFLGYWLRYPAKQARTTVSNIYDMIVNDKDFYLRDLVFPKPENRR